MVARLRRGGWNDGHDESFAYTEVDNTFELGFDMTARCRTPPRQERPRLRHQRDLARAPPVPRARRHGFILGDGRLTYGRETIVEGYYTASLTHGVFAAIDGQFVANPGFNQDRGPVWVGSLRLHFEF